MILKQLGELSVEEVANSLTHGFGLILSIAGFAALLLIAAFNGGVWQITSSMIYGASLVTLYAASTLYHSTISLELKRKLQVLDHCCIYLLIAGSYTPFALLLFRETFGFWLLGLHGLSPWSGSQSSCSLETDIRRLELSPISPWVGWAFLRSSRCIRLSD